MICDIKFSSEFERAFKRLKKRYRSLPTDFKQLLDSLVDDPFQGTELRDGMRKVRIAFASKGKGKRAGGRIIIQLTMTNTCLSFLYIYDKGELSSVSDDFLDSIILNYEQ